MSNWSGWAPSSPTDAHASDVGDPNIDLRALLEITEDSQGEQATNPFAFTKTQLGKRLYDPKDLTFLEAMGGLKGLTLGLQVDVNQGLLPDEDILEERVTIEEVWRLLEDSQQSHEENMVRDDEVTIGTGASPDRHDRPSANLAGDSSLQPSQKRFRDRRRVFGENVIPVRPPKSILQLMWIALHDKVLV
jgi:P-type Ca2+ transporter type 2C